jgi:hypothetical protein
MGCRLDHSRRTVNRHIPSRSKTRANQGSRDAVAAPNLEDAISRLDIHPLDECLDAPKHGFLSPNVTGQPPSEA